MTRPAPQSASYNTTHSQYTSPRQKAETGKQHLAAAAVLELLLV